MLKIAGCLLVIYSSFTTGQAVGSYHTRMVKEIEEILLFIRMIKSQIVYEGTELPELLEKCEDRAGGSVRMWLRKLSEAVKNHIDKPFALVWEESLEVLADMSALGEDVMKEMKRLGRILGDMDIDSQISRINLIEDVLTDKYERERNRNGGVKKLANSLGLLGGIFIVIMLL